jgi:hypothetical protein
MTAVRRLKSGIYRNRYGIFGTPFEEVAQGPEYSFGESSRAERTYFVPWGLNNPNGAAYAAWYAAQDFLGWSEVVAAGTVKYISRHIPHPLPGFNAPQLNGFFFAKDVTRWEGSRPIGEVRAITWAGDNETIGIADEAKMTVVYDSPMYQIMTDSQLSAITNGFPDESSLLRYIWMDVQPGGKIQTFKGFGVLRWDRDGAPMTNDFPVLLNEGELLVRWFQVPIPAYPLTAILSTVGKTNKYPFGLAGSIAGVYPAGTLVCLYPKVRLRKMVNGKFCADIDYKFKIYPNGANSFFRTDIPLGPVIGGGVSGLVIVPGSDIVVNANGPFADGDYVTLTAGAGAVQVIGGKITKLSATQFSLNNTALTPPEAVTPTPNAWKLAPGFFPASRSGAGGGPGGVGNDPIFPFWDYKYLFQPEP